MLKTSLTLGQGDTDASNDNNRNLPTLSSGLWGGRVGRVTADLPSAQELPHHVKLTAIIWEPRELPSYSKLCLVSSGMDQKLTKNT